jgi:hypothetical protein
MGETWFVTCFGGTGDVSAREWSSLERGCDVPRELQESRRSYIERRAFELTEMGGFINCHAIEVALRAQGYIEAYDVLNRHNQRTRINELCAQVPRTVGVYTFSPRYNSGN